MSTHTFGWAGATLALARLAAVAGAQDVCYPQLTSATITECVPNTGAPKPTPCGAACPNPLVMDGPKGGPITIAVPMPSCQECGCATCVHANVYTTSFATFCPEGITTQVYVVKELYTGMPAPPSITQRPDVPLGFVQGVQTCNSCGPKAITTRLTYPADGCPFVGFPSGPAPAPGGIPGWVVSPNEGGPGYTPSQNGKGWVPAPPKPEGGSYGYQNPPTGWYDAQAAAQAGAQAGAAAGPGSGGAQAGAQAGAAAGPGSGGTQAGAQAGAAAGPGSGGTQTGAQAGAAAVPGSGGAQAVPAPGAGPAAGPGSNVAQGAAPASVGGGAANGPAGSPDKGPGSGPGMPTGPPAPGLDKPAGPPGPGMGGSGYQQVSGAWVPTMVSALAVAFGFFSIAVFAL